MLINPLKMWESSSIWEPRREEVVAGWRTQYDDELCNLYALIQYMHACMHAYIHTYIHTYNILVGKHEGKRPCGRPWHRW
jgi:hypothetical protein